MKNATEIVKLRNEKGIICNCANCGREITNLFQVDTKIYGSECVITLFGGEKEVKDQMFFAKSWNKVSDLTKKRSMEIVKMTEDQLYTQYVTTGRI